MKKKIFDTRDLICILVGFCIIIFCMCRSFILAFKEMSAITDVMNNTNVDINVIVEHCINYTEYYSNMVYFIALIVIMAVAVLASAAFRRNEREINELNNKLDKQMNEYDVKTIAERASVYRSKCESEYGCTDLIGLEDGYIKGATEQQKIDLKNACKWLNVILYDGNFNNDMNKQQLIDVFRKAMEKGGKK